MRGIAKSRPPDNVSPDGQPPASLRDSEGAFRAALPEASEPASFARSAFDQLEKRRLRAAMYREQRSLCIYCERRVAEGPPRPRIDHWRPLSLDPELALHWKNLYLSCASRVTCDAAKRDRPLRWSEADPQLPWPADFPYEECIGFTSRGEMYVRSDAPLPPARHRALELAIADRQDGDRVRRGIVNLNHPALVEARAEAVADERARMANARENGNATGDGREERAARLLGQDPRPAFVSIRVAWLRRHLGRGR